MSSQHARACTTRAKAFLCLLSAATPLLQPAVAGAQSVLPGPFKSSLSPTTLPWPILMPRLPTAPTAPEPADYTLSWTPPTENRDGSALTNLTGYRIYSGRTRTNLDPLVTLKNPGLTRYVVTPETGNPYFAITAVNGNGVESALSNVADAGS